MTPCNKIKLEILRLAFPGECDDLVDDHEVEEEYEARSSDLTDTEYDFRSGEFETGIPSDYSRHYESRSVATKMPDGSWVGWTYWYGGGKHGEPEAVEWMEHAYDIECTEEEKMVVVRTFRKR